MYVCGLSYGHWYFKTTFGTSAAIWSKSNKNGRPTYNQLVLYMGYYILHVISKLLTFLGSPCRPILYTSKFVHTLETYVSCSMLNFIKHDTTIDVWRSCAWKLAKHPLQVITGSIRKPYIHMTSLNESLCKSRKFKSVQVWANLQGFDKHTGNYPIS